MKKEIVQGDKWVEITEKLIGLSKEYWVTLDNIIEIIDLHKNKTNDLIENDRILDKKCEWKIDIKKLEEKYKDFWTPDLKQIKIIDSWNEDFKIKMKWVLIFKEEVTEIKINDLKFVFDKEQLINKSMTWYDAQKAIEKLWWRRGLYRKESELLLNYFYVWGEYKEFIEIFNLTFDDYWLSYSHPTHREYAGVFDFSDGLYRNSIRESLKGTHYNVLCIHSINS